MLPNNATKVHCSNRRKVADAVSEVSFVALTSALMLFTLVSNSFVIYAVRNYPPLMKQLSNYWISSLACTDLLMASFVMPVAIGFNTVGPWAMGSAMCKVI